MDSLLGFLVDFCIEHELGLWNEHGKGGVQVKGEEEHAEGMRQICRLPGEPILIQFPFKVMLRYKQNKNFDNLA